MRKKRIAPAFSLTEILISLIIITITVAAFAPVISKKISGKSVKIGQLVSSKYGYIIPTSQEDCPDYSVYVAGRTDGKEGGVCVTKWNLGDSHESNHPDFVLQNGQKVIYNDVEYTLHYIIPDSELNDMAGCIVSSSTTEPFAQDSLCCWGRDNVSMSYSHTETDNAVENPSTYSGESRTVCTYQAAVALCSDWKSDGMKKGDWKLPTIEQLQLWQATPGASSQIKDNINVGANGLQLCSQWGENTVQCAARDVCFKTDDEATRYDEENNLHYCEPYSLWSSTVASEYAKSMSLNDENVFQMMNFYPQDDASVRCIAEWVPEKLAETNSDDKKEVTKNLTTTEEIAKLELPITADFKAIRIKDIYSAGGDGGETGVDNYTYVATPYSEIECPNSMTYDGSNNTCTNSNSLNKDTITEIISYSYGDSGEVNGQTITWGGGEFVNTESNSYEFDSSDAVCVTQGGNTACTYSAANYICNSYPILYVYAGIDAYSTWYLPSTSETNSSVIGSNFEASCPMMAGCAHYADVTTYWTKNSTDYVLHPVRCTSNKVPMKGVDRTGGGGGASGQNQKDIEIPTDIVNSAIGGKVLINRLHKDSTIFGNSNIYSSVLVYDSSDKLIWGYRIQKGADGGTVVETSPQDAEDVAQGGKGLGISEGCKQYNSSTSSWDAVNCLAKGNDGQDAAKPITDYYNADGVQSGIYVPEQSSSETIGSGADFNSTYTGGTGAYYSGNFNECTNGSGYASGGGGGHDGGSPCKGGIGHINIEYTILE